MGLDINTPKGQENLKEELEMLRYISKCWKIKIKITKKNLPYPHDGIMLHKKKIIGVFESKNRQLSIEELENFGTWLITYDKIKECRKIAMNLKVPLYGFLGLEKSKLVMYWKICDENGNYLFHFNHQKTYTQATTNGGVAYRDNAYLPIEFGRIIEPNQTFF